MIGFDLISDLNLTADSKFDWEGKPTSLYCLIAGNISSDISVVDRTLRHLSTLYQGVFYIDGGLEHNTLHLVPRKNIELKMLCSKIKNVVYLHNNVVIVDGIAIVGVNGWYGNYEPHNVLDELRIESYRHDDMGYLGKTIERLQLHVDVKRILIVSNSVPMKELYFGAEDSLQDPIGPAYGIVHDTEKKITSWVYGTCNRTADTNISGIRYVNNSCYDTNPYWAKRVDISL